MEQSIAIDAFSALANGLRMQVVRLLMREAPRGVPAGAIARALDTPPSTLSSHLARLERAGLVVAERDRQRILYAANAERVRALVAFLVEDCCHGRPELCGYPSPRAAGVNSPRDVA